MVLLDGARGGGGLHNYSGCHNRSFPEGKAPPRASNGSFICPKMLAALFKCSVKKKASVESHRPGQRQAHEHIPSLPPPELHFFGIQTAFLWASRVGPDVAATVPHAVSDSVYIPFCCVIRMTAVALNGQGIFYFTYPVRSRSPFFFYSASFRGATCFSYLARFYSPHLLQTAFLQWKEYLVFFVADMDYLFGPRFASATGVDPAVLSVTGEQQEPSYTL